MLPSVPISPCGVLVVLACEIQVKERILVSRALLAFLFHSCINSCHLDFPVSKACSWQAKRCTTETGKDSSSLLSGAAVCTFLLILLPVPEPWEACTRLKDSDQPSEPLAFELLYPGLLWELSPLGHGLCVLELGFPSWWLVEPWLPLASSAICPQWMSKQNEDCLWWRFKYQAREGDR